MLAAPVDERRNRFARDQVEPAADQRKTLRGEIDRRRRYVGAPGKPWFDRMLVRGSDIGEVAAEQRAEVAVDQLVGHGVLLPLAGDQEGPARADRNRQQDRGSIGEPAGRRPGLACARSRLLAEREADPRTQRL